MGSIGEKDDIRRERDKMEGKKLVQGLLCIFFCLVLLAGEKEMEVSEETEEYPPYAYYQKEGGVVIYEYLGKETSIIIPDKIRGMPVIGIDGLEHYVERYVERVVLPDSIQSIGEGAFWQCINLREIVLPSTIKSIEDFTFDGCINLTEIVIPPQVEKIGIYAFATCRTLKEIEIPEGVEEIGEGAFKGCNSLERIEIKGNVKKMDRTFMECTGLKEVRLPHSLLELGDEVFYKCTSLERIMIPQCVETIGMEAFSECRSLKELKIPDSVKVIAERAFSKCTGVTSIVLPRLKWMDPEALKECTSLKTVFVPDETKVLVKRAAEECELEELRVVEKEERKKEGFYVYEVTEEGVIIYEYLGKEKVLKIPEKIEEKPVVAVEGNRKEHQGFVGKEVEEVILPKTLKRIGSCAFEGTDVIQVSIEEKQGLEEIGEHGFKDCKKFITTPWAEQIGVGAFEGCSSLFYLELNNVNIIGDRAFYGCKSIYLVKLGEQLESIGSEAFKYCKNIMALTFPNTLKEVGSGAFEECRGLLRVDFNDTLTRLDSRAFQNCVSLEEINLPSGISTIEKGAFLGCSSLQRIDFPNGLREIKDWAFSGCTSLKEIFLPGQIEYIGFNSFQRDGMRRTETHEIRIYCQKGSKTWKLLQDEKNIGRLEAWEDRPDDKAGSATRGDDSL